MSFGITCMQGGISVPPPASCGTSGTFPHPFELFPHIEERERSSCLAGLSWRVNVLVSVVSSRVPETLQASLWLRPLHPLKMTHRHNKTSLWDTPVRTVANQWEGRSAYFCSGRRHCRAAIPGGTAKLNGRRRPGRPPDSLICIVTLGVFGGASSCPVSCSLA